MLFSVKKISNSANTIIFELNFDPIPQNNSYLRIEIYKNWKFQKLQPSKKDVLEKIHENIINSPFPNHLKFEDLASGSLFKFKFLLINKIEKISFNIDAATLSEENETVDDIIRKRNQELKNFPLQKGLSLSEKMLNKFSDNKNTENNRKEFEKHILNARKTRNINTFINSDYKFSKPKTLQEIRKKRVLLAAYGLELYDETYQITKKNKDLKILNNEWFLGPFYIDNNSFKAFF